MKQEEYLEQLLELQRVGDQQLVMEDAEIAACLEAAEQLSHLQEIAVPTEMAARIEHSLRARVRSSDARQQNGRMFLDKTDISPRSRSAQARRTPKHRAWTAMLGMAAVLVLAFAGLLALSAHSQPGHDHPPVDSKQLEPRTTPTPTSTSQNPVSTDIARLQSALDDLRTAVADRRGDSAIQSALKTVATRTDECRNAVAALPSGSQRATAQQDLNNALAQENQTVRQLLNQVDWSIRLLFTQQLGTLGALVPTVTHAGVHTQSNGTLLITLTGMHFASQAVFMLNGKPVGTVSRVTAGQLVATIRASQWLPGSHVLGILNPDGTAAQFVFRGGSNSGDE